MFVSSGWEVGYIIRRGYSSQRKLREIQAILIDIRKNQILRKVAEKLENFLLATNCEVKISENKKAERTAIVFNHEDSHSTQFC